MQFVWITLMNWIARHGLGLRQGYVARVIESDELVGVQFARNTDAMLIVSESAAVGIRLRSEHPHELPEIAKVDDLRPEYSFKGARRGKHAAAYAALAERSEGGVKAPVEAQDERGAAGPPDGTPANAAGVGTVFSDSQCYIHGGQPHRHDANGDMVPL